ncbi:uncharacterized protein LOC111008978 [Momordica charantia]|uniref:Uncharacterized protein LOC111008978 n=1 Tax=Momordica charantia TaxID=3673 RepID=A0A6J1C6Z1_MOMCH|nr:uncharacterized protein LOC111008978 [Momordica charantia]
MARGLISPPRSFAGSPSRPLADDLHFYMSQSRRPTASSVADPSDHRTPPRTRTSQRRHTAEKNADDLQNYLKKLDRNNNNSSTKTTAKISSSRPSISPRNGLEIEQPRGPTPISHNAAPKPKPAPAIDSPAPDASTANNANLIAPKFFDSPHNSSPTHLSIHGSGQRQNINNVGSNGGASHTPLAHPQLNSNLHKLSGDGDACVEIPIYIGEIPIYVGKHVANIVLRENSIYKPVGSNTKQEWSSQSNDSEIFQIYKGFASHRQKSSSVTSYFKKLKILWDQLRNYSDLPQCYSLGAKQKLSEHVEREKVIQFLVGLNDSYSTIVSQILQIRPLPTVEKAYFLTIQEEKQRALNSPLKLLQQK